MKYFGNDGKDLGNVRALLPTSFPAFVDQCLTVANTVNITRQTYRALEKDRQNVIKRTSYVVPCVYPSSPFRRTLETATGISLVCLDVDEPELARPFVVNPILAMQPLSEFSCALYSTASSTPENPRVRIFVSADIPVSSYKAAVVDVAARLGFTSITKESLVACQPMYLPLMFQGDQPEDHPLRFSSVAGRTYDFTDIVNVLPTSTDIDLPELATEGTHDELDLLRNPVEGVTLKDVAEALDFISPDCSYADWLSLAAALRHQFRGDDARVAYDLFDTWSAKGKKYQGKGDTATKWRSLKPHPKGRAPVTIRSLFHKAQAAGWSHNAIAERAFRRIQHEMLTGKWESPVAFVADFTRMMLMAPTIDPLFQSVLVDDARKVVRDRFRANVSRAMLQKAILRARRAMREEEKEIPAWARGVVYLSKINQFHRHITGEQLSPEALDRAYGSRLLPTEAEDEAEMGASRPVVRPQDYLLNHVQIPVAYDTTYDPSAPNDKFVYDEGRTLLNIYIATHPEPIAELAAYAEKLIRAHLAKLIHEPEFQRTYLDWMAYNVQYPGQKIRWAPMLQGAQGCGKTYLSCVMETALGKNHVRVVDHSALSSQWNDWSFGSQLVTLEEVRVVGHSRHEVMNQLKPLITNDTITVNERFRNSRNARNVTNYMLFTNHHDALPITDEDRRYFILKSVMQTREQVQSLPEGYFRELFGMLQSHAAGVRHFLENHQISDTFDPSGHAPRTPYAAELIADTSSEVAMFIRNTIEEADHMLVQADILSSSILNKLGDMSDVDGWNYRTMQTVLREFGYVCVGRRRFVMPDGSIDRHAVWYKGMTPAQAMESFKKRLAVGAEGPSIL